MNSSVAPDRPQRGEALRPATAGRSWRTTFGLACVAAMTRMTPAPTVRVGEGSMTMKLPVERFVV